MWKDTLNVLLLYNNALSSAFKKIMFDDNSKMCVRTSELRMKMLFVGQLSTRATLLYALL